MSAELERALTQLRGDYDRVRLELRAVSADRDQLKKDKSELIDGAWWSLQNSGKLVGAAVGQSIPQQVEKFLRAIIAERDKIKAERKELENFIASLGFRV